MYDVHCLLEGHLTLSCSFAHIICIKFGIPTSWFIAPYVSTKWRPYFTWLAQQPLHSTPLQDIHTSTRISHHKCLHQYATLLGLFTPGHQPPPDASLSLQGLRTLVLGTKVLSEEVWADWDSRYQDAAAQLDNRDEALAALAVEIEADLEFVGVTAIEDKLQEGVPAAIQSLLDAGMKVSACW